MSLISSLKFNARNNFQRIFAVFSGICRGTDFSLIQRLYCVYGKLLAIVREANSNGEVKKKGKATNKSAAIPATLASLPFLRQMLDYLMKY